VSNGQISCVKRVPGAAGLAIMWDANVGGKVPAEHHAPAGTQQALQPQPGTLPIADDAHRPEIEDWGLFDYPDAQGICQEFDQVRMGFIEALKTPEPAKSAATADAALAAPSPWRKDRPVPRGHLPPSAAQQRRDRAEVRFRLRGGPVQRVGGVPGSAAGLAGFPEAFRSPGSTPSPRSGSTNTPRTIPGSSGPPSAINRCTWGRWCRSSRPSCPNGFTCGNTTTRPCGT